MDTPIYNFVKKYSKQNISRLHMPGHKGQGMLGCEKMDITEIEGADTLYTPTGIIKQSEDNATALFGTKSTFYSTEGSSLAIRSMITTAYINKNNKSGSVILATRNAHKSFVYTCGSLDLTPVWLWDEDANNSLCKCNVTAQTLEKEIIKNNPFAVYVTSPDYLGNTLDIKSLAEVAHKYNLPLLVDNAHGCYLKFLSPSAHPIDLGADMCCDSAHKTLPVLTPGAYLHVSQSAPDEYLNYIKSTMEIFGTTSPSYLTMASLDLANLYLTQDYSAKLNHCIDKINALKDSLKAKGYKVINSDPLKLTIKHNGSDIYSKLAKQNIQPEYNDPNYIVLMFTPENPDQDYIKLGEVLKSTTAIPDKTIPSFSKPKSFCSIRQALFSKKETVPADMAVGKVAATPSVSCPPAIPITVCGEIIDDSAVNLFKYYGIKYIDVMCN